MGAAYTTETLTLPLAIAQRQDELWLDGIIVANQPTSPWRTPRRNKALLTDY